MLIIGVDPGLRGALATWDGQMLAVFDMPTLTVQRNGKNRNVLDVHELARLVRGLQPGARAYMELVGAMPGQMGMFTFGDAFGVMRGIFAACDIPVEYISPVRWKRRMQVPAGRDKEGSLLRVKQLLPQHSGLFARKKDDGRAEASLLALYGMREVSEMGIRDEGQKPDIFG